MKTKPQPDPDAQALPDVIPQAVQQLVALFGHELSGVEFPEVGAAALAQAVAEVEASARQCESARAEFAAAEAALDSSQSALVRLAERGLAYAKVYAADDAALTETLESIRLSSVRPERAKLKRKRREVASAADGNDASAAASVGDPAEASWTN